jgi:hypothetical protein
MEDMDRRTALALGVAVATSALALPTTAMAQTAGTSEGKEVAPGVRVVEHGKRASMIPAYKTVSMRDIVFQPGKGLPETSMENDMVCHITEGERETGASNKRGDHCRDHAGNRSAAHIKSVVRSDEVSRHVLPHHGRELLFLHRAEDPSS